MYYTGSRYCLVRLSWLRGEFLRLEPLLEHHDRLIMIGVINDAIEDLVRSKFGDAAWEAIYTAAFPGQAIATFEHFKPYDDAATLALVGAAALALNVPAATVLELYGEHLVKYAAALFSAARTPRHLPPLDERFTPSAPRYFGRLHMKMLKLLGSTLVELLNNLDFLHVGLAR